MRTALITILLLVCCFAAGAFVDPRLGYLPLYKRHSGQPLEVLLGESRRLFAGQASAKADAYFHSGMYPTMFDARPTGPSHVGAGAGLEEKHDDHAADFLAQPRDIIDRFSRSFYPSEHRHLGETQGGGEKSSDLREILPWLKLTAELDPNNIPNYVVAAYWLRSRLDKVKEAEEFLRLGLEHNPNSFEILFELGRIYLENKHELDRARNILEAALKQWDAQNRDAKESDNFLLSQIVWHLAALELDDGKKEKAIHYMELARKVSPEPAAVDQRIQEVRAGTLKELGVFKHEHKHDHAHDDHGHAHDH
jgi:tetratricopeptide (TPR) repeat protein